MHPARTESKRAFIVPSRKKKQQAAAADMVAVVIRLELRRSMMALVENAYCLNITKVHNKKSRL